MLRNVRGALVAAVLGVSTASAVPSNQLCLLGAPATADAAAPRATQQASDGSSLMVLAMADGGQPPAASGPALCTPRVVQVRTSLNVRVGPGLEYDRIGSLGPGASVCVLAEQDGWYEVAYGGGTAWICARYVGAPDSSATPPETAPASAVASASAGDAATGRSLDRLFSRYPGSTMQGKGDLVVALSRRYGVPLDLALGMLGQESTFCSRGKSVRWNNPGNIRDLSGRYGAITGTEDRFAKYVDIDTGLEAFFKLLSRKDGPYWRHIQSGNYAALYRVYAPSSDGNDEGVYRRETEVIRRFVQRQLRA